MRTTIAALLLFVSVPATAAPPYPSSSALSLDAAVRSACPQINGVSTNGSISFQPGASASCQSAANLAMQNFVPVPTSVQINSTSNPAINGSYSLDALTQSKILAVSLYIQVNNKFPAGFSTLPFPDSSGTMHNFTSPSQFLAFASALADYTTAITLGQSPSAPITIP